MMTMNVKRVLMLRTDAARQQGNFYLLPHADADALIARGAAKHVDNTGKPFLVNPGPSETKPAAPSQVKKNA
jgi:hypothetical protein